jgi:hypothetical protein
MPTEGRVFLPVLATACTILPLRELRHEARSGSPGTQRPARRPAARNPAGETAE